MYQRPRMESPQGVGLGRGGRCCLARQQAQAGSKLAPVHVAAVQMAEPSRWVERVTPVQDAPIVKDSHFAGFQLQSDAIFRVSSLGHICAIRTIVCRHDVCRHIKNACNVRIVTNLNHRSRTVESNHRLVDQNIRLLVMEAEGNFYIA